MTAFLSELSKKIAERWLTLLVLPGALFLAAATAAAVLGHSRALSVTVMRDWINALVKSAATGGAGIVAPLAAGVLVASAGLGLLATAIGATFERAWTTTASKGLARLAVEARRRRWLRTTEKVNKAIGDAALSPDIPAPEVTAAIAMRDRIGRVEPERATWIGDRFHATDLRVHRAYDLDLVAVWPRLWLVVPDSTRNELSAAQDSYAASARLTAWGVLYIALATWWWPGAVIGAATISAGWYRARSATSVLADLVESTVDLYGRTLAAQLGIECSNQLTPEVGLAITTALRKDS